MSTRAWTWRHAVLKSVLPATTRHVLLTLSCHVNDAGENCFPSTKTLETETGLSERTVCTHLEDAAARGWIKRERHGYGDRRWARYEYHLCWPRGAEGDAPPTDEALNLLPRGTEPDDNEALKEVQSNISKNISGNIPGDGGADAPGVTEIVRLVGKDDVALAFEHWNVVAERAGLPRATALSDKRRKALEERIQDAGGLEAFKGAIDSIATSDFLIGISRSEWRAHLDWLLRPDSFQKLAEGTYHHGAAPGSAGRDTGNPY